MKNQPIRNMTTEQLVEQFVLHALGQDKALLWNEIAKFNALYRRMEAIEQELKARHGDLRSMLLKLFDHPNAQVRLKAAEATLAVAPEAARQTLEAVAKSKRYPQAGHAGMTLVGLDRGEFKPT